MSSHPIVAEVEHILQQAHLRMDTLGYPPIAHPARSKPIAPNDPRHGRYTTYNNFGCRCDPCSNAISVYKQQHHRAAS